MVPTFQRYYCIASNQSWLISRCHSLIRTFVKKIWDLSDIRATIIIRSQHGEVQHCYTLSLSFIFYSALSVIHSHVSIWRNSWEFPGKIKRRVLSKHSARALHFASGVSAWAGPGPGNSRFPGLGFQVKQPTPRWENRCVEGRRDEWQVELNEDYAASGARSTERSWYFVPFDYSSTFCHPFPDKNLPLITTSRSNALRCQVYHGYHWGLWWRNFFTRGNISIISCLKN